MTSVMEVLAGRSARHAAHSRRGLDVITRRNATTGQLKVWPIRNPGMEATGCCVPFPTKESLLRNAGETRGLLVLGADDCFG